MKITKEEVKGIINWFVQYASEKHGVVVQDFNPIIELLNKLPEIKEDKKK